MVVGTIKAEWANPFITSTIDTFAKMVHVDARPGKPIRPGGSELEYDISGVIGLAGEVCGSVCLSFPRETALKVVNSFMSAEYAELDAESTNGVAELANIIAGYAKAGLAGYDVRISLPNIVEGRNHKFREAADALSLAVPFATPLGRFDLLLTLKRPAGPAKPGTRERG